MKDFATLIRTLDATNKTNTRVNALADYFTKASDSDKVWTIAVLSHRRPPRPIKSTNLRAWATEMAGIPIWLFEESYHIVGDLAETIALIVPQESNPKTETKPLADYLEDLIELKGLDEDLQKQYIQNEWKSLDYYERFVLTKFMTGGFRIGISQKLMTRALAKATGIAEDLLAYRLMGNWNPSEITFNKLILEEQDQENSSRPYPFFLAYGLEDIPEDLGSIDNWVIEHKWDGIRAQLICRKGEYFLWSRGEELITDSYPELAVLATVLPEGTVLDGELLAFPNGQIGSFNLLQQRLGRKTISRSLIQKIPVILRVYDVLEWEYNDIRESPLQQRRAVLESLFADLQHIPDLPIDLSPVLFVNSWDQARKERENARSIGSEGLMIKQKQGVYGVGRKKGNWWKWKIDPLSVDAVLTYAMRGHGRRSNLFTDYTFALWGEPDSEGNRELVTFAKAYSGLTDAELKKLDRWIKENTLERFGPVRAVKAELVFEIAFEGIARSSRHKSGVATRFPRILRWRTDKNPEDADTLENLKTILPLE